MSKKSLLIDGMLSGTGIRDALNGGYLSPHSLGLSAILIAELDDWLNRYADVHFAGYVNADEITALDELGLALTQRVASLLPDATVAYFSNAHLKRLP